MRVFQGFVVGYGRIYLGAVEIDGAGIIISHGEAKADVIADSPVHEDTRFARYHCGVIRRGYRPPLAAVVNPEFIIAAEYTGKRRVMEYLILIELREMHILPTAADAHSEQ